MNNLPDPCPQCGWQYPQAMLDACARGEMTLDPTPTHLCRSAQPVVDNRGHWHLEAWQCVYARPDREQPVRTVQFNAEGDAPDTPQQIENDYVLTLMVGMTMSVSVN